jgi:hypothetical protein
MPHPLVEIGLTDLTNLGMPWHTWHTQGQQAWLELVSKDKQEYNFLNM